MIRKIALILAFGIAASWATSPAFAAEDGQIAATKEVAPAYPKVALSRKHTGWAVVEYSVNKKGRATNVVVTDSEPAKVFDRAARKAILMSRFEVPMADGEPTVAENQIKKFVFELDEEIPGDIASRKRW